MITNVHLPIIKIKLKKLKCYQTIGARSRGS